MSWIEDTQKAVKYIEDRLCENVTAEDAASHIHYSSGYFQRMFLITTGFTVGEYIRNRKLSLAGRDLTDAKNKVLETALKYGYETPESFAKAFRRFHGFAPSGARSSKNRLKYFDPLVIKISITGGFGMSREIIDDTDTGGGYSLRGNERINLAPTPEDITAAIDGLNKRENPYASLESSERINDCRAVYAAVLPVREIFDYPPMTADEYDFPDGKYEVRVAFLYGDTGKYRDYRNAKSKRYMKFTDSAAEVREVFMTFFSGAVPDVAGWEDLTPDVAVPDTQTRKSSYSFGLDGETWSIIDPSDDDIDKAIAGLHRDGNYFAILSARNPEPPHDCQYIQTAILGDDDDNRKHGKYQVETQFASWGEETGKVRDVKNFKQRQYQLFTDDAAVVQTLYKAFTAGAPPDVAEWTDISAELGFA